MPPKLARSAVDLTVEIKYLHHTKRHHSDTDERRAEKQRASDAAHQHEGTGEFEYAVPIERWTAADVSFVIDMVRNVMPTEPPDGGWTGRYAAIRKIRFRTAGHSVTCSSDVGMHREPARPEAVHLVQHGRGYAACILLPAMPPATALIPFACSSPGSFDVRIELNPRAARQHARRMAVKGGEDA